MIRLLFAACLIGVISTGASAKKIQCACTEVKAKGIGESKCNVSVSGSYCLIDFNEFSPASLEKARIITRNIANKNYDGTDFNYTEFNNEASLKGFSDSEIFANSVTVYMLIGISELVAEVEGLNFPLKSRYIDQGASKYIDLNDLVGVYKFLRESGAPFSAFVGDIDSFSEGRLRISKGCISFQGDEWSLLFKTPFSASAAEPRC